MDKAMECVLKHEYYLKTHLAKAEEPEIKLPTSIGSAKKQESSRKTFTYGNFFKRWEYQTT